MGFMNLSNTPGSGEAPRRTRPRTETHSSKLGELFAKHYGRLVRRLRSRVSVARDAEDIAAEALAKVLEVPEYETLSFQEAYLYRTALNLATNLPTRGATKQRYQSLIRSSRQRPVASFDEAIRGLSPLLPDRVRAETSTGALPDSPQHVEEVLEAACLWHRIRSLSAADWADIEALADQLAPDSEEPVQTAPVRPVGSTEPSTSPSRGTFGSLFCGILRSRSWRSLLPHTVATSLRFGSPARILGVDSHYPLTTCVWALLLLIALALAPVYSFLTSKPSRTFHYQTTVGERRVVRLPGGSVADLNTDTEIAVLYSPTERLVVLSSGEALFRVVHDPKIPFRVMSGLTATEDVGTLFEVYRVAPNVTRVTVVEGSVAISRREPSASPLSKLESALTTLLGARHAVGKFDAGQQVEVSDDLNSAITSVSHLTEEEIQRQLAWREDIVRGHVDSAAPGRAPRSP